MLVVLLRSREELLEEEEEEHVRPLRERWIEDAWAALVEATGKLRRVQLLFRPDPPTARQASNSVNSLSTAAYSIQYYYQSEVNQAEPKEPDSMVNAIRWGASILGSMRPGQRGAIDRGEAWVEFAKRVFQDHSVEDRRQSALATYRDKELSVDKSLNEFVRGACAQLHLLDHSPWFRRADRWIIDQG